MSNISRFDPIRDIITMRQAVDRMLGDAFMSSAESRGNSAWLLPMDAYFTDEAIVIHADVPGLRPDEIEITLEGDTLTIRGEIKRDEDSTRRYVLLERPTGRFERTLTINTPIDHDKVEATFSNGVLTLTLPKAEAVRPRQITVKSG